MSWTPERNAALSRLWDQGASASEIARELGPGFNRNMVIGKAHRLGLKARLPSRSARQEAQARALGHGERVLFRDGGPSSRVRVLLVTEILDDRVRGHEWSEQLGRWLTGKRSVPRVQLGGAIGPSTKTRTVLARLTRAAEARARRFQAAEAAYQRQLGAIACPISASD